MGLAWPIGSATETALPRFELNRLDRSNRASNIARIRGARANAYVGDNVALCWVLGRFKMYVDTTDLSLTPHLLMEGYWEMWVTEVIAATVKPGMICVDAGANVGYFTLVFAELTGAAGHVHAFEPNRRVASLMQRSAIVNGYAEIVTVDTHLLEDRNDAYMQLNVPSEFAGGGHMAPPIHGQDLDTLYLTKRMDSYPSLLGADVVKIDAEGAEWTIWQGMTGIFDQGRPMTIFIEFVRGRYPDARAFVHDIITRGFNIDEVTHTRGPVPISVDALLSRPKDEELMLRVWR
jgi:FkbM family methyltransferase